MVIASHWNSSTPLHAATHQAVCVCVTDMVAGEEACERASAQAAATELFTSWCGGGGKRRDESPAAFALSLINANVALLPSRLEALASQFIGGPWRPAGVSAAFSWAYAQLINDPNCIRLQLITSFPCHLSHLIH